MSLFNVTGCIVTSEYLKKTCNTFKYYAYIINPTTTEIHTHNYIAMKFLTTLCVSIALLFYSTGSAQQYYIDNTPGPGTFTVPCDVTFITVHLYGGGGGGGGSNDNGLAGGGGGGGGYVSWTFPVTPGQVFPYEVGSGGAAGCCGFNGGNGSQSNWNGGVMWASGGLGGLGDNFGGLGGGGGTGSGWAGPIPGGTGGNGNSNFGGGGGNTGGPFGGGGGSGGGAGVNGGPGGPYGGGGGGSGPKSGGVNPSGGVGADGAVIVEFTPPYPYPNAGGPYPVTCNVTTLQANTPDPAWTGTWVIISGSPTISNVNDPNATLSIATPGTCATIAWVFTQAGCQTLGDTVTICYPLLCNDEPCGGVDVPLTVNIGSCTYTTYSNIDATNSTGMVEPGCGNYQGNDAWYEVTVPASGTVTINATQAAGNGMEMALAIYSEGANCLDIQHAGCDAASSPADIAELTYSGTPGETIYVRVWEQNGLEGQYNLCAMQVGTVVGDILPGSTTINCPSTQTWYDPGGAGGNYQNNTTSTYIICPSTPGQYVTVDFSTGANFFNTEPAGSGSATMGDFLTVLDGNYDSSYIIGQYSGSVNPLIITSSTPDGCLTFIFASDNAVTATGWQATVSCSATPGVNDSICTGTDCPGECGTWICASGLYPTENIGNVNEDMSIGTGGCFDEVGEVASQWFYFTALTNGSVEFSFNGPGGQDYNFAIYGPSTNDVPPCPQNTGDSPVLCTQADVSNYFMNGVTGQSTTIGDGGSYEGEEGDGWIIPLQVQAGETYAMVVNIYQNGGPQPVIDMVIGGTGTLDCTPVFAPVELSSFNGINQGSTNKLFWSTNSEINNDYFTVERSVDGINWEVVDYVDGSGTTSQARYYELRDPNPFFPLTYYRLSQTDFDGTREFFDVISVSGNKVLEGDMVSNPFPNPTNSYVNFTYLGENENIPLTVALVNDIGQTVSSKTFTDVYEGMQSTLEVRDLSSGLYQVVFTQGDRREVKKLSIIK